MCEGPLCNDMNNCGSTGNVCPNGQLCTNGQCICRPPLQGTPVPRNPNNCAFGLFAQCENDISGCTDYPNNCRPCCYGCCIPNNDGNCLIDGLPNGEVCCSGTCQQHTSTTATCIPPLVG